MSTRSTSITVALDTVRLKRESVLRYEPDGLLARMRWKVWIRRGIGALLIGGFLWYGLSSSPNADRYEEIASQLAGRPITLHCDGRFGWTMSRWDNGFISGEQGFAEIGGEHMYLSPRICRRLDRILASPRLSSPLLEKEEALLVFAHEVMHLRGEENESAANCQASGRIEELSLALGFYPADARTMQQFVSADLAQNTFEQPDAYVVPAECLAAISAAQAMSP